VLFTLVPTISGEGVFALQDVFVGTTVRSYKTVFSCILCVAVAACKFVLIDVFSAMPVLTAFVVEDVPTTCRRVFKNAILGLSLFEDNDRINVFAMTFRWLLFSAGFPTLMFNVPARIGYVRIVIVVFAFEPTAAEVTSWYSR